MSFVDLLILILACWRLTSLLYAEKGPGNVFTRIRCRCGIIHDENGFPMGYPETFLGGLLGCYWCLSVWFGIAIWIAHLFFPVGTLILCFPFALSGGAILLNENIK